jgi:hypothetical protein
MTEIFDLFIALINLVEVKQVNVSFVILTSLHITSLLPALQLAIFLSIKIQ